ncbi:MAG: sigma-70 family RNA polymerase sigma factor [Clostridia bacterium]|nr:sigma-70 family RNA polymerase sigma factor [Clostridia bacterium]
MPDTIFLMKLAQKRPFRASNGWNVPKGGTQVTKENYIQQIAAHKAMMYRIAFTILQNDFDVQDALQEAALKAWEKQHTLKNDAYFATWMTRILINESYQIRRRQKRVIYMDQLPETKASPDGITLRLLMESLPDRLRLPFVMKYVEGMKAEDIAYALHTTRSAVNSRIHRAKTQLRKELDADEASI